MQVTIEKRGEILGGFGQAVRGEHLAGDAGIGAAGDLDRREIILEAKARLKAAAQRTFPRASGGQERSIDIEQQHGRARHAALLSYKRAGVPSQIGAEA